MAEIRSTREQLENGEITLPEVADHYLTRIREEDSTVNAFVSVDEEEVLDTAARIQKKIDEGRAGTLAGSVIGIKDLICEKGKITSCASAILKNFESIYDATVIERLRKEDALLIGRLNMDEFAMGSSTENTIYGPTRNPLDTERVSGGSSGGSAAAVAADFCNAALGSDTGGSIRQPASYCGVVGLKPTYGRVSRHGLVAYASSFDGIGPMTSNVRDAAKILKVIAGYDSRDNTTARVKVPDYESYLEQSGKLKVGVPSEYFGEGLNEEVRRNVEELLEKLERRGDIERVPVEMPHMEYSIATYYVLATAEASSNLARYDGVRYGHRAQIEEVHREIDREKKEIEEQIRQADGEEKTKLSETLAGLNSPLIRLYKKSRTEGFGREVKRRILLGTYVLSAGYYDAYYAKAQKVRRLIREDFDRAFSDVDLIVSPTAPTTAFHLGENQDDPVRMYLNDIYTAPANLAGICAISLPAGAEENGLPTGIQFMADRFREDLLFRAGRKVEQLLS